MKRKKYFYTLDEQKIPLPAFFPDATRAVIKTLDSIDIKKTKTPGILVNTYHLYQDLNRKVLEKHQGIKGLMSWKGGVVSDSGGFQVMSLIKSKKIKGKIIDKGMVFSPFKGKTEVFTPEKSIRFQMLLKTDLVIALDDFTPLKANYREAEKTVARTILWAQRSKKEFLKLCQNLKRKPYLLAVVQGGRFLDLRKKCLKELVKIGFDGLGYGGWPLNQKGYFDYQVANLLAQNTPPDYFLFGLGIGKPEDIVGCGRLGFNLFDCVLPTRNARHKQLYLYNASSIEKINLQEKNFYSIYEPEKEAHLQENQPVSTACDCLLCQNYSRGYLAHLFRIKSTTAQRLATIHNLRFYSILMEKLREEKFTSC